MAKDKPTPEAEAVRLVACQRVRAGGGLVAPGAGFSASVAIAAELVAIGAAQPAPDDEVPAEAEA